MSRPLPDWQPLPATGETPALEAARLAASAGSGLVALAVSESGHRAGWGPDLAVEIGRRWVGEGASVHLVDLNLDDPRLHGPLEAELGEGMTDALFYGASLGRVLRPAAGLQFATTGTPVPDPGALLESDGLKHVLRRLLERGGISMLYVCLGAPGSVRVLDGADQVVLLSEPGFDASRSLGDAATKTVAVVGPEGMAEGGAVPDVPVRQSAAHGLPSAPPLAPSLTNREPDPFDVPEEVPLPEAVDPTPSAAPSGPVSEPERERALAAPASSRGPLAIILLLLVLVLLAIAIQMGWIGAPSAFRSGP